MNTGDMYHLFIETRSGSVRNAVSAALIIVGPGRNTGARAAGCFHCKTEKEAAAAMFELGCVMAGGAGIGKLMVHAGETDGHDPFGIGAFETAARDAGGGVDCFNTGSYQYLPGGPDPDGDNYWWEGAFSKAAAMAAAVRPPYALKGSGNRNDAAVIVTDSGGCADAPAHAAIMLAGADGGKKAFLALSGRAGPRACPRTAAVRLGVDAAMLLSRAYGSCSIVLEAELGNYLSTKKYAADLRPHGAGLAPRASIRQPEREWEQAVQEALIGTVDSLADGWTDAES